MPAVELVRLRGQVETLMAHFADPGVFQRALQDLLDGYANRAFRPGQGSIHISTLPSYYPTPLVMRELEIALSRRGQQSGGAALRLVAVLRGDPALEPRLLAAHLLGSLEPEPIGLVLEQLQAWCTPQEDRLTLDAALDLGARRIRIEAEPAWRGLVEAWILHAQPAFQRIGLRAMLPAFKDPRFINLPPLQTLLGPMITHPQADLLVDLQELLQALIERSPAEAVFYLRQMVNLSQDPLTARLARRLLPLFPAAQQESLRVALRAQTSANTGQE